MKSITVKIISMLLILMIVAAGIISCNNNMPPKDSESENEPEQTPADSLTGEPSAPSTDEPSAPSTDEPSDSSTDEVTDAPTEAPVETDEPQNPSGTIAAVWNRGYVGSDTNANNPLKLHISDNSTYSYTDVLVIAKKGTKLVFIDDNANDNGDGKFASTSVYVFSSWKQDETGEWVLDLDGVNIAGSSANNSVIAENVDGVMRYTYVTCKDNEAIRICFRAGKREAVVPTEYPTVTYEVTGETPTADLLKSVETES